MMITPNQMSATQRGPADSAVPQRSTQRDVPGHSLSPTFHTGDTKNVPSRRLMKFIQQPSGCAKIAQPISVVKSTLVVLFMMLATVHATGEEDSSSPPPPTMDILNLPNPLDKTFRVSTRDGVVYRNTPHLNDILMESRPLQLGDTVYALETRQNHESTWIRTSANGQDQKWLPVFEKGFRVLEKASFKPALLRWKYNNPAAHRNKKLPTPNHLRAFSQSKGYNLPHKECKEFIENYLKNGNDRYGYFDKVSDSECKRMVEFYEPKKESPADDDFKTQEPTQLSDAEKRLEYIGVSDRSHQTAKKPMFGAKQTGVAAEFEESKHCTQVKPQENKGRIGEIDEVLEQLRKPVACRFRCKLSTVWEEYQQTRKRRMYVDELKRLKETGIRVCDKCNGEGCEDPDRELREPLLEERMNLIVERATLIAANMKDTGVCGKTIKLREKTTKIEELEDQRSTLTNPREINAINEKLDKLYAETYDLTKCRTCKGSGIGSATGKVGTLICGHRIQFTHKHTDECYRCKTCEGKCVLCPNCDGPVLRKFRADCKDPYHEDEQNAHMPLLKKKTVTRQLTKAEANAEAKTAKIKLEFNLEAQKAAEERLRRMEEQAKKLEEAKASKKRKFKNEDGDTKEQNEEKSYGRRLAEIAATFPDCLDCNGTGRLGLFASRCSNCLGIGKTRD